MMAPRFPAGVIAAVLGVWPAAVLAQPGTEDPAPAIPGLAPLSEVLVLETPPVDVVAAVAAASVDGRGGPVPFADPFAVDVSTISHGRWEASSDGRTAVWRLRVVSPGAVSLNLGFDRYRMPPGGRLRVHTPMGDEVVGPFTEADNEAHGELWTQVLSGGDAVIEVSVPVDRIGELDLRLDSVNRGFRDLADVRSPSHGSCSVDVACSSGDAWRDQIRSVGLYSVKGSLACSGALLNNTALDARPLFLTAYHCFANTGGTAASVVVYWNYQRPVCGSGTATLGDSQSGATFRYLQWQADIALLELDDRLEPEHDLYLAGWDLGSQTPASAVGIHHPKNHFKSINVENELLRRTAWSQHYPTDRGTHWRVGGWASGANEKGSSGSPLFDANKRIVGTLTGGDSECGNAEADWYGALTKARLALDDVLDPIGTGDNWLDGMNADLAPRSLQALDDKAVKLPGDGESPDVLTVDLAPFFFDDGSLTYTATSSDESKVTVAVTGSSVSITPVATGVSTIMVTATEAEGDSGRTVTQTFRAVAGANRSPETVGTLGAQKVRQRRTVEIALASAFTDGEGDALTYAASSTDASVARVSLSGSTLTVEALEVSPPTIHVPVTIDVTATDTAGSGTKARHRFPVTVFNDPPEAVGSPAEVQLRIGDGSEVVDVSSWFTDPEGDALDYTLRDHVYATFKHSLSGSMLTLSPVARGRSRLAVGAREREGLRRVVWQGVHVRVKNRRGVIVSAEELNVVEGATATYTVVLDSEPTGQVTIAPSVASGGKVTVSPSSLTFEATDWETAQTVTVTGVEDDDMASESVTIGHAVSGADYGSVTAASVSVKVLDDEGPPVVSIDAARGPENGGPLTFDVALAFSTTEQVTVDYATSDDTARAGSDYTAASGTLTFAAGTTTGRIVVSVVDDERLNEGEETFLLTLRNPVKATLAGDGSTLQAVGTIEDDDFPPFVGRWQSPTNFIVWERETIQMYLYLDRHPEREVRVRVEPTNQGGADQTDYFFLPSTIVWQPGEQFRWQRFRFLAVDDDEDDDCESVTLKVVSESQEVILDPVTIRIVDDDGATVDCGGSGSGSGGGGGGGGGGGAPPLPEPEPDPQPPPPPSRPPTAAFGVEGATCAGDLCRALTGEAVRFTDTSAGAVRIRRWEFGDGNTSRSAAPIHAWSSPGFYEVELEVSDGTSPSTARRTFLVEAAEPKGTCVAAAETLCLRDSRYAVAVEWRGGDGQSGSGRVVHAGTNDSGLFAFFDANNWEVLIKVLDGCAANGHVWVYGGSTTDLGYAIRVTDTLTGASKEYRNEPGSPAAAISDVTAFSDGCRP